VRPEDARAAALRARELGAQGWRVECVLALCAQQLGERDEAYRRAEAALADLPPDAPGANAALVLAIFAEGRQRAIADAVRAKKEWPGSWMSDVNAAYSVLARHPLGTDAQVVSHHDFLKWFGARAQATQVLEEGLARFPSSWLLHDRLRGQLLRQHGVAGLEPHYDAWLARPDAPAGLSSFAGYAALVAAEFYRRRGEPDAALSAYGRGIAHYERWSTEFPDERAAADHYVAMAMAGRARVHLERGEEAAALEQLLESFQRRPQAAASLDGLNLSPVDTARTLLARLREQGDEAAAGRLDAALAALDPDLLQPQAYERAIPGGASPDARRFGGRRERTPR
jgi:tetratricopeptide (TPR) repeat protein